MTLKHQHKNLDETVIADKTMVIPTPIKKSKKDKEKPPKESKKEPVAVVASPFVDESVDHLDLPSSSEDHSVSVPKLEKSEKERKDKEQQRLNMIAV